MKNILLLTLVSLSISIEAFSQNAYYDALFCASLRPDDAEHKKYPTITFVGGEAEILDDFKSFLENPFGPKRPDFDRVRKIFKKISDSQNAGQINNKLAGIELVSLLAPIFNLSKMSPGQTDTLLYGLTIRLAEEFRKGYMQTYLKGVEKTIGQVGELQVLFPSTYQKILKFDPIRYKDFGNEMKSVFDEDLGASLEHLREHIEGPQTVSNLKFLDTPTCNNLKGVEAYPYLDISLAMGQKLINGIHPSDIIGDLDESYYNTTKLKKEIRDAIHLLNILQRNLRDTTTKSTSQFSNVWINFEKLSKLNNPRVQAYFLALIYHEDDAFFNQNPKPFLIDFSIVTSITINSLIAAPGSATLSTLYNTIKTDKLTGLLSILVKIDEFTKLKEKSLLDEQNFELYLKNVGELIKLVATVANPTTVAGNLSKVSNATNLASNVLHIYNSIRVKNYSNIQHYLGEVLRILNTSAVINDIQFKAFIYKLDNFSSFASGIVSAKTSEDVSNVIKTYADPPASYIDKRNNGFRITLGGMPGLYFARETLDTTGTDFKTKEKIEAKTNIGLTLPIGLDFTFPLCKNKKGNSYSLGLFVQVLDLGAMLNYRLNTNANSLPDKVGWDAVLSPGAAISLGLPQTPWTLQFGYQRAAPLRRITKNGNDPLIPSDRWQIRLTYDIPLLKIVGKSSNSF